MLQVADTMTDAENEDKKVIGEEEREKMLNKENAIREEIGNKIEDINNIDKIDKEKEIEKELEAQQSEVVKDTEIVKTGEVEKIKKELEESQKESRLSSIRVPIGGIKIPGFLRSKSRDKPKEGDGTAEEGVDLLESGEPQPEKADKPEKTDGGLRATLQRRLDTLAARSPFGRKDAGGESAENSTASERPKLLDRLKVDAARVLPKRFTRNKDQKDGVELTGTDEEKKDLPSPDDGMESVKLDGEGEGEKDVEKAALADDLMPKRPIYLVWLDRLRNLSTHEKAIVAAVLLIFLILIIVICATSGGSMATAPPVVNGKVVTTTQCGPVEGAQDRDAFVFYGIPFAVPPVGPRRWRPAQGLTSINYCWTADPLPAVNSSTLRQCWQQASDGSIDGDEDCLYLDIWTPEVRYINPVPVVVIIDTPTLLGGERHARLSPTPQLVHDREVVFVRPNFRLGVLGFLAADPLRQSVHPPSSGNYGLTDIIVALQWVQTNIAHFGGDSRQVTVLGHRAGATLVTALATSARARGLFARAWATSGSSLAPTKALHVAEKDSAEYVEGRCPAESSGNVMDCLMKASAETLMEDVEDRWPTVTKFLPKPTEKNATNYNSWIVLDGHILKEQEAENKSLFWREEETEYHTPLVAGTTAQSEASAALQSELGDSSESAIIKYVRDSVLGVDNLADEVLARYNGTWEGVATMVTDVRTVCPLLAMAAARPNTTFYVATQARNHTGLGSIADVSLDISAILGQYTPNAPAQADFVKSMQDFFYRYVTSGVVPPLPSPRPVEPVLTVSTSGAQWRSEYPACKFWVDKNYVPLYARRD